MAFGKIQTITTFSDNSDYSEPIIRQKHITTLATPTEAVTFRGQAGPYGSSLDDGIRSLVGNNGLQDLANGINIENVQQVLFTNRSTDTTVYVAFLMKTSEATGLVVNVDADGGEGNYASITRNTGSWEWVSTYYVVAGDFLQLTAAPSGANSSKGGSGKGFYTITSAGATAIQIANTGFADSTGETISMAILSHGTLVVGPGQQIIMPGSMPTTALSEGNAWSCWTTSGTADFDFTMMGTT